MRPWFRCRRGARLAGALLLVAVMSASGCGRLPDEAWLRFLGFTDTSSGTPAAAAATTFSGSLTVFSDELRVATDGKVSAELENRSVGVGTSGSGTGILVYRARVEYYVAGFDPPAGDYPLNLYLAPPKSGETTPGTLTDFPLAPAWLKQWLLKTHRFDDADRFPYIDITARVTFYGVTDEGTELQTTGGIGITLTNTDASP